MYGERLAPGPLLAVYHSREMCAMQSDGSSMQIACNARLCELYTLELNRAKTEKPSYAGLPSQHAQWAELAESCTCHLETLQHHSMRTVSCVMKVGKQELRQ